MPAVTVTAALADLVEAKALWAVTVTALGGTAEGAVYTPVEEIVPADVLPPDVLFTSQFTEVFVAPVTVAVNCWVAPVSTLTALGDIATDTGGGAAKTVTAALADCADVALCAVTVTVLAGTAEGATYNPVAEIVPKDVFPPAMLFTSQFTEVFVVPVTVAVNCCVKPT